MNEHFKQMTDKETNKTERVIANTFSKNATLKRLISDPSNKNLSLGQGLRSVLVNYVGTEINEDQLQKMIMMVFLLKTIQSE
jgi:hypothetical protein